MFSIPLTLNQVSFYSLIPSQNTWFCSLPLFSSFQVKCYPPSYCVVVILLSYYSTRMVILVFTRLLFIVKVYFAFCPLYLYVLFWVMDLYNYIESGIVV